MWAIVRSAQADVDNHSVLYWARGCESLWDMLIRGCESFWGVLSQLFVNHDTLCCTSVGESWRVMLRQWLWIMVSYAELVVVKYCELCRDQCVGIIVCYAEPVGVNHCASFWDSGCESWHAMISKYVGIMVCYSEPMAVNDDVLCWTSGCKSLCGMLN